MSGMSELYPNAKISKKSIYPINMSVKLNISNSVEWFCEWITFLYLCYYYMCSPLIRQTNYG